jgi:hypothetical protein
MQTRKRFPDQQGDRHDTKRIRVLGEDYPLLTTVRLLFQTLRSKRNNTPAETDWFGVAKPTTTIEKRARDACAEITHFEIDWPQNLPISSIEYYKVGILAGILGYWREKHPHTGFCGLSNSAVKTILRIR